MCDLLVGLLLTIHRKVMIMDNNNINITIGDIIDFKSLCDIIMSNIHISVTSWNIKIIVTIESSNNIEIIDIDIEIIDIEIINRCASTIKCTSIYL